MMGLGRIGHLQDYEVRLREQVVPADVRSVESPFDIRSHPFAVAVEHLHFEAARAPSDRLADPAHADDAQRCVMNIDAQPLLEPPAGPFAGPDVALDLREATRGCEHQSPCKVGGGVVEHARRIGRHHAARGARRDVDVVVADGDVGDDFEARTALEQRRIDAVGETAHDTLLVGQPLRQRVGGERHVLLVGFHFAVLREISDRLVEHLARHQHFRFHRIPVQTLQIQQSRYGVIG